MDSIQIRGARTHNLKNIDMDLPRQRLIVLTGPSGSGKSSLAFDTLYAEGQRRYVESLSAYARQFLSIMEKPDVDHIEGLSPAIAIEQRSAAHNPRSTVGTVTEIYDYLRLLFARAGTPVCPEHGVSLASQTIDQMVDQVLSLPSGERLMLLAPLVQERKGEHQQLLAELRRQGFIRVRIDGRIAELDNPPALDARRRHTIELVVDRFGVRQGLQTRLAESFETALRAANGVAVVLPLDDAGEARRLLFSARFACPHCGYSVEELHPQLFSFNNPVGACPACEGLGAQPFFDPHRVVHRPELSLTAGAIRGWDCRNPYVVRTLEALAAHYGFDLDTPYCQLPNAVQKVLLFGSGEEPIRFRYPGASAGRTSRTHPFEGIVNTLQRRYRETESNAVREELAKYLSTRVCPECAGTRLNTVARHVLVADRRISELTALPIGQALIDVGRMRLGGQRGEVAARILKEIALRLEFLVNVGLDYLTLERSAETLSGGEAQRIRLASQIGAGLVGVMYVLDEPSIGLHPRDNQRLLATLRGLQRMGNTVIVVEHDAETIRCADHIVDMGPGAGSHGGQVIAEGTPEQIMANGASLTGRYLAGQLRISVPRHRLAADPSRQLELRGCSGNNLRDVDVDIPLGLLTCVTGVSGSGKSTLINDTLFPLAARELNGMDCEAAPCCRIAGLNHLDRVVAIDQSPIGRTPRSNPATYTGLFTPIRELFANTPEGRSRGYTAGRFSFNVKGGRCEACKGDGLIKVEMHFLPDVYVRCDICQGMRYNRETLEVRYRGKSIDECLEMTVEEARGFFHAIPILARKLETLLAVGLGYVRLGQNATTLSGGEAQRVKLARELSKRDTGRTLYILDEPTTGLHFHDIAQLLGVLRRLRDRGNTIVVIEHNLDVIKTADWIIDLGPEGGERGGQVIATATPEALAEMQHSHTGTHLRPLLDAERALRGRHAATCTGPRPCHHHRG